MEQTLEIFIADLIDLRLWMFVSIVSAVELVEIWLFCVTKQTKQSRGWFIKGALRGGMALLVPVIIRMIGLGKYHADGDQGHLLFDKHSFNLVQPIHQWF
jgi:hypothetical protein